MNELLEQAGYAPDGEGDLRFTLIKTLVGHYLVDLGCSHEGEGSNTPACWCGWVGPESKNVGTAVAHWSAHAVEQLRPILAEALA